ncbi:MAG: stage II sporulation protein M [Bacilli bacterium]|jgi:stage II sporulation protein M|nr:stage II sporulation protein M [Bacilli bacterium]
MITIYQEFKKELSRRKRGYAFIFGLILAGCFCGSLFMSILDNHDKLLVINKVKAYFDSIKDNNLNYLWALKNNFLANFSYIILLWLLGLSIIGLPLILFFLFFKGFIIGFGITSIIYQYKIYGLFIALLYIFPHYIITVIITMILGYYAVTFSINLLLALLKSKTINFAEIMNRYLKILSMTLILTSIVILYTVFVIPNIIRFFLP